MTFKVPQKIKQNKSAGCDIVQSSDILSCSVTPSTVTVLKTIKKRSKLLMKFEQVSVKVMSKVTFIFFKKREKEKIYYMVKPRTNNDQRETVE